MLAVGREKKLPAFRSLLDHILLIIRFTVVACCFIF